MKRTSVMFLSVAAIAVVASIGAFWPWSSDSGELVLPGTFEIQEVRLGSKIGGRVADVSVLEGAVVDAGRVLVTFDAPELKAQKEQILQRLAAAQANLKKAEAGPRAEEKAEAFAALQAAQARQERVLKGWREEEVRQAKYDLEAAEADREFTKKNFERMRALSGDASLTELDNARNRYSSALSQANSARSRYEMLTAGNRIEDKNEIAAELARAKARYDLIKAGTRTEDLEIAKAQVHEMEARLREIEANLAETTVSAPSKMIVEVVGVRKGDLVPPNQPVVRGLQAEDRWVKVFVPSTDLGKLNLNDKVNVTCDSYPGKVFSGTIIQIATISEFTPRNVQSLDERRHQVFGVKVHVDDRGEVFKSGMAAEVTIPLREKP